MLRILWAKLREAVFSVLPVALLVILIDVLGVVRLSAAELVTFCVCTLLLIIGIALFNMGADMAMSPMGTFAGTGLAKTGRFGVLLPCVFVLGMLVTVAEPDLSVLASQISTLVEPKVLIFSVGAGVGLFLLIGTLRIVNSGSLTQILMFLYMLLFSLAALAVETGKGGLIATAFDSGGVTTGPLTVPFIMALGLGISTISTKGEQSGENSFGLISLCSVGPVLAVLTLSLFSSDEMQFVLQDYSVEGRLKSIPLQLLSTCTEVGVALGLITVFFMALEFTVLKLPWQRLIRLGVGIIYTYAGLVIFLAASAIGYMPVGYSIGTQLGNSGNVWMLVAAGVLLGLVTVLAEPAVHVLNRQIEDATGGSIKGRSVLIALSIGTGISLGLSLLRVYFGFSLIYYLIPGYMLSLLLSFFVPGLYTAIAFDSGGVASGPMTSCFVLPLSIGACVAVTGGSDAVPSLAFGVVSMVAMTPLITIQVLGFRSALTTIMRRRRAMRRILSADDCQIIEFAAEEV